MVNLVLPEPLGSLVTELLEGSLAIHLTVVDAKGKMIVIEFDSQGTLYIKQSPMGVLTNEPQLEIQYQLLSNWTNAQFDSDGVNFPVPGGFDPIARFQRLALLNLAANFYPFRDESYSPWDGTNATSGKSQMVQLQILLTKVTLPLAINYNNQLEFDDPELNLTEPIEKDRTQYTLLRDHTNRKVYYNSPYDQTLRSLSIDYLKVRRPRLGVYGIPLNAFKDWFKDVSGSMPQAAGQFGTAGQFMATAGKAGK